MMALSKNITEICFFSNRYIRIVKAKKPAVTSSKNLDRKCHIALYTIATMWYNRKGFFWYMNKNKSNLDLLFTGMKIFCEGEIQQNREKR